MENKKNEIKIKKLPYYVSVENPATIKVFTSQNGIIEVESVKNKPFALNRFIRLNKYEYIDKETGEIKKYKKTETRNQSPSELRKTFKNLKRTINSNFTGTDGEKHITLTFSTQSIEPKLVHIEFKRWWRTMKKLFPTLEYICILEPNDIEGNWHLHILVKSMNNESLDISQELLNKTWKHGFSKVTDIKNVDNIRYVFLC